jgi:DNA-binding response OmpR family regulator
LRRKGLVAKSPVWKGGGNGGTSKILVVDDDPDILEAIGTVLESQSYQVVSAGDGEEGLAKLEKERPDAAAMNWKPA